MAKLNVNPTRMELSRLKSKLVVARKGHKLLKDKQDELMRVFIEKIKENKDIRENVEKNLRKSLNNFTIQKSIMNYDSYLEALSVPLKEYEIELEEINIMGVKTNKINFNFTEEKKTYSYLNTTKEFDYSVEKLNLITKDLIKLAELEKMIELMATEIEKTRRRVNALEYMTIPELEETIKFIRMKLDENDRASIIRLMKANIK